ncbi:hypothetical protein EJD97_010201, partial [Solanum chilense]
LEELRTKLLLHEQKLRFSKNLTRQLRIKHLLQILFLHLLKTLALNLVLVMAEVDLLQEVVAVVVKVVVLVVAASLSSTTPVVLSSVTTIPCSNLPSSVSNLPSIFPSSISTIASSNFPFFGLPPPVSIDSPTLPHFSSVDALATPNVTNLVTIKLGFVEEYLTWRTHFTSLLLSHELMGLKSFAQNFYFMSKGCSVSRNLPRQLRVKHILFLHLFKTLVLNLVLVVAEVDLLPKVVAVVAKVMASVVVDNNHK